MKPIIKCVDCGEMKPHNSRGMCERCYGRWKWNNGITNREKALKRQYKWRKDNPDEYRKIMREYMRKRLKIKPENYYKK